MREAAPCESGPGQGVQGGGGEPWCPATKGSGLSREACKEGTGVGLPDKIAIENHKIKEVWPGAASLESRQGIT